MTTARPLTGTTLAVTAWSHDERERAHIVHNLARKASGSKLCIALLDGDCILSGVELRLWRREEQVKERDRAEACVGAGLPKGLRMCVAAVPPLRSDVGRRFVHSPRNCQPGRDGPPLAGRVQRDATGARGSSCFGGPTQRCQRESSNSNSRRCALINTGDVDNAPSPHASRIPHCCHHCASVFVATAVGCAGVVTSMSHCEDFGQRPCCDEVGRCHRRARRFETPARA